MSSNNTKVVSKPNKMDKNDSENYTENLIRNMSSLMENDMFCDITLISGIDNFKIKAHRSVLAASSDYFNAMFTGSYKESKQKEVVLNDFDGYSLKLFINYFYTGHMDFTKENLVDIGILSDQYCVPLVLNSSLKFLKNIINNENCIDFVDHPDIHYLNDFSVFVMDYIKQNFQTIIQGENFLHLSSCGMKNILSSDELNVSSEEDVVFAIIYWLDFDVDSRREHLKDLIPLIRMTQLEPIFIQEYIQPLYEEAHDLTLSALIMDALYWHGTPDERKNLSVNSQKPRIPKN